MATYADIATLMNSSAFRDAVTIAVVKYASFILNESAGVANHNQRAAWAKNAYQSPGGVGGSLLAAVAWDSNVQATAPAVPADSVIQSATENAINTTMAF